MSSNLLKFRGTDLGKTDARVIDTNQLIAQRLEALSVKAKQTENPEGFTEGLSAEVLDVTSLLCEENTEGGEQAQSQIIKAQMEADAEKLNSRALEEANAVLAEASEKANQILAEAEEGRSRIVAEAKEEGYRQGLEQAKKELEQERRRLAEREKELETEYEELIDQLEPQFIDHLTDIYEHIFKVDLSSNREIIEYLISMAMRKVENSHNFILHVSKEDYPYISMRKQQLLGGDMTMEIIEDITLNRNECRIETENGIFDCGLGTQLAEVTKKMKLLAYQNR